MVLGGFDEAQVLRYGVAMTPLRLRRQVVPSNLAAADVGRFEVVVGKNGKPTRKALTRIHDLRHTFGTRMTAAGAPIRSIQEWMGHASIQTTEIYADYAPDPSQGRKWAQLAFGGGDQPEEIAANRPRMIAEAEAG